MINVVCVKHGTLYSADYVNKLYNSVKRNTTIPFKFTCFTEDPTNILPEIKIQPFIHQFTGWWNKIYLFAEENGLVGRIFYLDLDTVIVNNIDAFINFNGEFAILRDMYFNQNPKLKTNFGSALMSWEAGYRRDLWTKFLENPEIQIKGRGHGDQGYLMRMMEDKTNITYWQDFVPGKIESYKVAVRNKPFPENASIIIFHGLPKPKDCENEPFMQEHWK